MQVILMPVNATPEVVIAAALITRQADQNGAYKSRLLAPGKYLALATSIHPSRSYENIARLWNVRSKAKEIALTAGKTLDVKLEPID